MKVYRSTLEEGKTYRVFAEGATLGNNPLHIGDLVTFLETAENEEGYILDYFSRGDLQGELLPKAEYEDYLETVK